MKQTILGGILASTALTTAAFAQETLTAVHAFPESLIYTKSFLEFVDKVNTAGEGVVQIEVRGGPEAIGMFQQPDAVRNGVVDMVYTPGSFYAGTVPEGLADKVGKPFIAPHIFVDAPVDGYLATNEIFGPILVLLRARDFEHALEIANMPAYKLTGGVYSRMPRHLERSTNEFRVGNLYLNRSCTGALVGRQPFGGFGMSGIGSKAGGHEYLSQFAVPRALCENTMRRGFAPGM